MKTVYCASAKMKYIGVTALLTLAILTECLGAQSDRSRSRSSPVRSVPVGANVKRDVDFDCPEEFGYYPHPTDCTLYYVCVFGGALLESCTGGLMYSHELQTCDWPRNVGCDGTSALGGEELERLSEREPPPPPPPRRAPPPPPRAQPNPVVTSRGQPKFNRQEYEKQQQLYAEVDDLPPIEELESDRQQRVYRGQPATIGQVQKDRDGYASQQISSGRTLNSNIIPASLSQSNKIGSFSFGSQVDDRRTASITPAPQSYSEDKSDTVTDSHHDRLDIETNEIKTDDVIEKHSRKKRETVGKDLGEIETSSVKPEEISKRSDSGEEMEYIEFVADDTNDEKAQDDTERGKRQVRYYLKNGYKTPGKNWALVKPVKIVEYQQPNYNPNVNNRYQQSYNNLNNNNYYEASRPQSALNNNYYSTANPFLQYQAENSAPQGPFKPSLPDNSGQQAHNPHNAATQIITKSPPISSLSGNNDNLFTSLAGGFINNAPKASNVQYFNQFSSTTSRPKNLISFPDSSQLPSTIVTAKPVLKPTLPRTQDQYRKPKSNRNNYHAQVTQNPTRNQNQESHPPPRSSDYEEETSSREEDSSEEDENEEDEDDYRYPEFKFPTNRYKDVVNPFANPEFDFDAYLSKLSYSPYSSGSSENEPSPSSAPIRNPTVKPTVQATTASHLGYRSPSPNPADIRPSSAPIIHPTINPTLIASTASHLAHRSPSPSPTVAYNALSTPKPFTVSFRPGTTALPVVSSIKPSLAPIKQIQQYEQAIVNPEPTGQILQQQLKLQEQQQQQHLKQRLQQKQQQGYQNQQHQLQQQQYQYKQNPQEQQHQTQQPNQQQQQQYQHQQHPQQQQHHQQQQQYQPLNDNVFKPTQSSASIPLDAVRPKLKPPNFKDDRQLPISYSFIRPIEGTLAPTPDTKPNIQKVISATGKPYYLISGTAAPGVVVSTPKQQYIVNPDKIISLSPHTGKPFLVSSVKPQDVYSAIKLSTAKPLTTLAQEQLSALQQYWNGPTTGFPPLKSITIKPSTPSNIPKLENLYSQGIKSTQVPVKNYSNFVSVSSSAKPIALITSAKTPLKRRPIPKPSPEMNDYYYDEDEEYYDEPEIKPKYMPSTEIKPQRPVMAQNDEEYDDSYEDDDDDEPEQVIHVKPSQPTRIPVGFSTRRPESATKNYNDVSIVTKLPLKDFSKNINGKIPVPVLVDYVSPSPTVLIRPELPDFKIVHHSPLNKTHIRKPVIDNGPNTLKPPKYLNQTTLRPYTVRHRLAKPTTVKEPHDEDKKTKGNLRHQNLVAQILSTTPRDSHNQETRFSKTNHDDKTNSLEPTESVAPVSYSASPRPKMLYNASQSYSPEQYDPFYAVYDEDGELYKDADYVQQYNTASLRPAVQQTYRGTPPPARRPVQTYTPRPSADDYDDELIQPQISNQNQYQAPIRHSTRGEGNELGYEHNPSSVKTTLYEATTIRTTPRTTTTSTTTTQRPTTAPYTEAMTPRYTPRSSTDESPIPESSSEKPSDDTSSSIPPTPSPIINVSSFAKPFEKTDNSHRLEETISTTEKLLTARRSSQVTNNNKVSMEVGRSKPNRNDKKVVSLTTGFSIRRDPNNTNNSYTLTVLTRPFDDYIKPRRANSRENNNRRAQSDRYYYDSGSSEAPVETKSYEKSSESSTRRKSYTPVTIEDDDIPVPVRSRSRTRTTTPRVKTTTAPSTTTTTTTTTTTENYDIQASKRPIHLSVNKQDIVDSTENSINTEALIEAGLQNAHSADTDEETSPRENYRSHHSYTESAPLISPYKTPDNVRNMIHTYNNDDAFYDITTPPSTTARYTTTTSKPTRIRNKKKQKISRTKPLYYSYRIDDDVVPDQTTEVFNDKVQNVIKTFFTNLVTTSLPEIPIEVFTTTTTKPTTPVQRIEDDVVNIGYQKKPLKYVDEKPLRNSVKRLQIITEPSINLHGTPTVDAYDFIEKEIVAKDLSSTSTTMATMSSSPYAYASLPTTPLTVQSSTNDFRNVPVKESEQSKYSSLIKSKPDSEFSQKFHRIVNNVPSTQRNNNLNIESTIPTKVNGDDIKITTEISKQVPSTDENKIASTTSTTKSTTTLKIEPTTSTTKSISFPTRASRVNPAIKLAATNPGSGRRSYQSSSKCSSDNSLQANPKCNEIKYQRPTSTRGRGTAHFSGSSDSAPPQPAPNRGTPPTRSRPTLKPSTAIVSKTTEFVDIYAHPASRPAPVYPQPTPDKTAAKCRKDVCQLPDCYCGGKDIPGDMPVEQVPQIVLLTFDDSVNDLNKGLYADLFEKGRVNPNGCPISATFYVSHEWTDYSQVQNLYSAGHEMASHTVSHSFGEQFSQKKWNREVGGQREILAAYGGVKLEDVRGMRAPFLSVGGNKMFKMLYDSNFTYDSSLPVYENKPPSWPYTLDYKLFHDCMIPPCPTKSYPGVWEVPMVMWQDLNGGRCSMGDACANPPEAENVYKMILKNFDRHYTTNRAPFGLFYHAAWFTQPHHKEGFIMFLDFINQMQDVWIVTNWQALQWVRDPTPISRMNNFQPFQCNYQDRPKKCNNPKVCNLWHKSGVRYMRTCQPCPEIYPWTGKSGISSSRIDNDKGE